MATRDVVMTTRDITTTTRDVTTTRTRVFLSVPLDVELQVSENLPRRTERYQDTQQEHPVAQILKINLFSCPCLQGILID